VRCPWKEVAATRRHRLAEGDPCLFAAAPSNLVQNIDRQIEAVGFLKRTQIHEARCGINKNALILTLPPRKGGIFLGFDFFSSVSEDNMSGPNYVRARIRSFHQARRDVFCNQQVGKQG